MTTARDVMTPNPVNVPAEATLTEAARLMRDEDIGDVLVTRDGVLLGIVTDRDMVVRAIADGMDPHTTPIEHCSSSDLMVVDADDQVSDVIAVVRDRAIRRLPVTEDGRLVGIISLGDLARHRDPESALADISAAPANS
jgi:signal-transduction protein with cAMP-binding, CBS, and nucleotidyltransferase domain